MTYTNILNLIDKQIKPIEQIYQIQAMNQSNDVKCEFICQSKTIPTFILFEKLVDGVSCILISYLTPKEDIDEKKVCVMIGYVFRYDDKEIAELNYSYNFKIKQFEIHYIDNKNNSDCIIEKFETYTSNDEIIYLLSNIIIEYDIINKIKNN